MRSVLTILLTSLCWAFVIFLFFEPKSSKEEKSEPTVEVVEAEKPANPTRTEKKSARTEKKLAKKEAQTKSTTAVETPAAEAAKASEAAEAPVQTPAKTAEEATITAEKSSSQEVTIDYAREIDGKWQPVEGAEYPLEFTKYGTVIQYHGSLQLRFGYSLSSKRMNIRYDKARVEITREGNDYYLEIYNSEDFSGKYKRVSQPRKIAMRPLPESQYSELINGKWAPINGQEFSLEFTKYGAAIQYHGSLDLRYDYSLTGAKLNIRYDNARVAISEDASYYYLEIYNSEDFSGRYRKSK